LASGWSYVKDGKFVPSTSASMRCSDCIKYPTAPECGKFLFARRTQMHIKLHILFISNKMYTSFNFNFVL